MKQALCARHYSISILWKIKTQKAYIYGRLTANSDVSTIRRTMCWPAFIDALSPLGAPMTGQALYLQSHFAFDGQLRCATHSCLAQSAETLSIATWAAHCCVDFSLFLCFLAKSPTRPQNSRYALSELNPVPSKAINQYRRPSDHTSESVLPSFVA